jgi:hypothetical protein
MPFDMLVSFDVEALFQSIPVDEALKLLKKWLEKQHLNPDMLTQYLFSSLTESSMKIEQAEGTAMGNALSPFLANLYMANFALVLK